MSCSQEFVRAQLEERRRTTDHLHLLHTAATFTNPQQAEPSRPSLVALSGSARQAIRRCLSWFSASQLGPLPDSPDTLDPDHHPN